MKIWSARDVLQPTTIFGLSEKHRMILPIDMICSRMHCSGVGTSSAQSASSLAEGLCQYQMIESFADRERKHSPYGSCKVTTRAALALWSSDVPRLYVDLSKARLESSRTKVHDGDYMTRFSKRKTELRWPSKSISWREPR